MNFESLSGIANAGFEGAQSITDLRKLFCSPIPRERGVYLVVRTSHDPVRFLAKSPGPWLGGIDPTEPIERLEREWIPNSMVLYIGKAGGSAQKTTLQGRIRSYVEYGQGLPRTHKGGRLIWQLADADDLRFYWSVQLHKEPAIVESDLLRKFVAAYGRLPFANLRH